MEVYNFPINIRKFIFQQIKEFYEKENKPVNQLEDLDGLKSIFSKAKAS